MRKIAIILIAMLLVWANALLAQGAYTYKVGEYEVILLPEGQQTSKPSVLIGATPEMLTETMSDGTYISAVNAFLVKTPQANILVDTGYGHKLLENLASVGVSPEDIDQVLLTHMHRDHIGGLLLDGKAAFPNATLSISTPEAAYWTSKEIMNSMPENRRGGFQAAQKAVNIYEREAGFMDFEPLDIEDSLLDYVKMSDGYAMPKVDGVTGYKAFGHTPGHTMYMVESKGEKLLIWADLTHVMPIQMPYPEISVTYDVDPKMAAESRKKVLEFVTINKIPIAGMHIAYPAIGNVEGYGKAYRFIPVSN
ncbi:MAG: MBL fold metallo-hydrolase [Prevotellaceae bacterium]|jgi:glyoxylase-like metal-dependent hydrolase (beta-lactamase superfamily II)|nr:MBL fold metallo-hydrolase [Prevotellaceae bacterium]